MAATGLGPLGGHGPPYLELARLPDVLCRGVDYHAPSTEECATPSA